MPIEFSYSGPRERYERRNRAKAAVRAKYPNIIEGSSGWFRALNNQLRKRQ